ncbi:MAG: PHP domain-containing protein [Thermoplasmata archaeon]|jgi:predicted metal-dependent phosphoesterase TrpH
MKLDLHIHSSFSKDASASPRDILESCKRSGLDGCAVTDHNAIDGSLEAFRLGLEMGMLVVRGVEVSAKEGHVLAYGVGELIPKGLPMDKTIERIHSAGGIAVAAHPKRFPSGMGLELAGGGKFDAVEVLNGGSSSRSNRLARRLAEEKRVPITAGSDAHELQQVGKAYTVVEGVSTEADLIRAISKGNTRAGGRSRSVSEGVAYSIETLIEWFRGDFKRL